MRTAIAAAALLCTLIGLLLLETCSGRTVREPIAAVAGSAFPRQDWRHILVDDKRSKWGDFDEPRWLRYFGLALGDLTGDGYLDIVSGRYFYRNPGGDMTDPWPRIDLGRNLDAILVTDVDGDANGDLIAQALPDVYWVEAADGRGNTWTATKVAEAPRTGHINSQGFAAGQLVPGGKPEIVLASGKGIYYFQIPTDPSSTPWPRTLIAEDASVEGLDIADVDGDSLLDVVAANASEYVAWWKNPGRGGRAWSRHIIGATASLPVDRVEAGDIDGDGKTDVVVTEESVPGQTPDAGLYWFRQPADAASARWPRQRLLTEYSLNSLDTADMDGDGDLDIVTGEHKGPHLRLQLLENDGRGR
ncbi:MAG: VCBS repeat-containing protein, partial [Chromatiaceae bacterium]|nr:VCBS repeat-containing protein [Chromatiaceae bacterium]